MADSRLTSPREPLGFAEGSSTASLFVERPRQVCMWEYRARAGKADLKFSREALNFSEESEGNCWGRHAHKRRRASDELHCDASW